MSLDEHLLDIWIISGGDYLGARPLQLSLVQVVVRHALLFNILGKDNSHSDTFKVQQIVKATRLLTSK
jgi:hypothetical protein